MNPSIKSSPKGKNKAPLRVAIIDDDRTIRNLLVKLINKQMDFELCGAWGSGEEALANLRASNPDVVVVDLELPGISGADTIRALSAILPCSAFIVLTVHDEAQRVFGALQAGANGYLLKSSAPDVIVNGIYSAHQGGAPLSPEIAGMVIRAFQTKVPEKSVVPLPSLSPRERQILQLLATGMSTKEAAGDLHLSYETVRDYLKHIYQKLHVRSRTEAVLRYLEADEHLKSPSN